MAETGPERQGMMRDVWSHPWGRVLIIALTVAAVSWAIRETASITLPLVVAIGEVLVPLLIGFTIAYVLTPMVDAFSRHGVTRLVATFVIFTLGLLLSVVLLGLGVPALISQSTQLVGRTIQDQAWLDVDGDGQFGRRDRLLLPDPAQPNRYVADLDEDGQVGPNEPAYFIGRDPVRISPSMARKVLDWLDEQQSRVERYVGVQLDASARVFLEFYRDRTRPFIQVLDEGLQAAEAGLAPDAWPPALRVDIRELPELQVPWNRCWPGVLPERFDAAAAALPDDESRARWRAVMNRYGSAWVVRHRRLLGAQELVLTGRVPSGGEPAGVAGAVPLDILDGLSEEDRARIEAAVTETVNARLGVAAGLFLALREEEGQLARELQERLDQPGSGGDPQAIAAFLDELGTAQAEGLAYASQLFRALGSHRRELGVTDVLLDRLGEQVRDRLSRTSQDIAVGVGESLSVGRVLSWSLDLILIPIYAFFLTLAMPGVRRVVRRYLPTHYRDTIILIMHDIERVVAAFFRGRLIVCALCGILVSVGFLLCGVPYAVLFGLLIGIATAVPMAGLLFLIPAVMLVVMDGGDDVLWRSIGVIAVYTVVQTLEMTFFTPTIMGREVELHPVTLILALIFCGKLLGIIGLILAVPIAATVRILARQFLLPKLRALAELPLQTTRLRKAGHEPPP